MAINIPVLSTTNGNFINPMPPVNCPINAGLNQIPNGIASDREMMVYAENFPYH
jgi:hypothetical protein